METLDIRNDFVFKKIFGKKGNEEILQDFIISVLDIPIKTIKVDRDTYLEKTVKDNKLGILDIKATLNDDTVVNIEMQMDNYHNMKERSLFYWAKLYGDTLETGQDYLQNKRTITINILNYNLFKDGPYHDITRLRRDYNNAVLTEDVEIHFIQLPKCREEDIKTKLDLWVQYLGNRSERGVKKAMESNEKIRKAQEELEYLSGDEEARRIAFLREKAIRDEINNMNGARREGIEQGKKKGRKEGRKEKTLEIAKKLKEMNMSTEDIEKATGLTREEIERL